MKSSVSGIGLVIISCRVVDGRYLGGGSNIVDYI